MIRGRKPAGGGGDNPPSRGAVCDDRKHGSVGAGAGNRPGYPTSGGGRRHLPPIVMLAVATISPWRRTRRLRSALGMARSRTAVTYS